MKYEGVCRTAPATPGLLNRVGKYGSKNSKSRRTSKLHDRFKSYDNFNHVFLSMINEGATAPNVNIFTRALLPLKFHPKHFSFCFQSSNSATKRIGQRVGTSR